MSLPSGNLIDHLNAAMRAHLWRVSKCVNGKINAPTYYQTKNLWELHPYEAYGDALVLHYAAANGAIPHKYLYVGPKELASVPEDVWIDALNIFRELSGMKLCGSP